MTSFPLRQERSGDVRSWLAVVLTPFAPEAEGRVPWLFPGPSVVPDPRLHLLQAMWWRQWTLVPGAL